MATTGVKNLAGLNDIHLLLLHHLAVLNRKMRESQFGLNWRSDHDRMEQQTLEGPLTLYGDEAMANVTFLINRKWIRLR